MSKKLWEVDHPYYCSEGNYLRNGCHFEYESWEDFLYEWGDSDPDLNLVFRWDWREGKDWEVPEGEGRLLIYIFLQRKAHHVSTETIVSRDDEPAIRKWLEARAERIRQIWDPFLENLHD